MVPSSRKVPHSKASIWPLGPGMHSKITIAFAAWGRTGPRNATPPSHRVPPLAKSNVRCSYSRRAHSWRSPGPTNSANLGVGLGPEGEICLKCSYMWFYKGMRLFFTPAPSSGSTQSGKKQPILEGLLVPLTIEPLTYHSNKEALRVGKKVQKSSQGYESRLGQQEKAHASATAAASGLFLGGVAAAGASDKRRGL